MAKLSVVMVCYNEQAMVGKSLAAVQWADEIVVVDSGSTDGTVEIVRRFTDRVYQAEWRGFGRQKNLGLDRASGPWVLSVDADEVVTQELAGEIRSLLARDPEHAGYRVPRLTWYLGRFLFHAWYPDRKVRLFRKDRARWGEEAVHESLRLQGSVGELRSPLLHFSFPSIRDHLETLQRYTTLGAEDLWRAGKRFSWGRLLGSPLVMFLKQYVWKGGFRDGLPGLIACVLSGFHEFVKYAKLYERERAAGADPLPAAPDLDGSGPGRLSGSDPEGPPAG